MKLKTSAGNAQGALLSDEEYSRQRFELLKEKAALENLLQDGQDSEERLKLAADTLEFASTMQERFAQGDPDTKKAILTTVGSNLLLKDKKLSIEARKPFNFFDDSFPRDIIGIRPIEPENNGSSQRQKEAIASPCPSLLGDADDVRTLPSKYRRLVRSVYQFFERRASCGCEECRKEFFHPEVSVARRNRRKRWNSLPAAATRCVFKQ